MRRFYLSLGLVAVLAIPSLAQSYVPSPRYGAVELKFGPYTPNVDEESGLTGNPYEDTFGKGRMFLTTLELDYQFLHKWGFSFGVGGSFGFMQESAAEKNELGATSSDYTVLNVMPFALLGVVRWEWLANEYKVPLVPYIKGGINWYLWWVHSAGSLAEDENGKKARGGTMGWQFNPGLMIRLDQVDEMSARTFDNELGVNHSYLFIELVLASVEGFGRDGFLHLSPTDLWSSATWMAGIALEF